MAEEMRKKKARAPRQSWEPHWSLTALQRTWTFIFGVLKVVLGAVATVVVMAGVCAVVFMSILGDYLQEDIAPLASVELPVTDQNSFVLYVDSDGSIKELQRIFPENNSEWVSLEDIPENLIHATIAIEDKRFYEHQGVDWITTLKACFFMFFGNGDRGGSTITQQLVKNATGENSYTVQRKVLEIFRAADLERRYEKDDILEQYLNRIYMGRRCTGVKTAAAEYFGKELEMLTIAECASLISITNNPSLYNPYRSSLDAGGMTGAERNRKRQLDVLEEMYEQEWITEEELNEAVAQEMVFQDGISFENKVVSCEAEGCGYRNIVGTLTAQDGKYYCPKCTAEIDVQESKSQEVYSYYVDTVIEDVAKALAEADGITEWNDDVQSMYTDRVESGGYYIFACIDMDVQNAVDKIYQNLDEIPKARSGQQLQSAMVVLDNSTGDIVAMAGGVGTDKVHDGLNRATDSKLQSGSSIKPLSVYAPAFMTGQISPATVVKDMPLRYNNGSGWPKNDNRIYGYSRTVLSAVVSSVNAAATDTLKRIGLGYAYDYAKNQFGLSTLVERYDDFTGMTMSDVDYAPLAMGAQTKGVTVRDMASAFGVFANNGVHREGRTFTKVYDREGNLVLDNTQDTREVLNHMAVNYMNYCLENAVAGGTGGNAKIYGQYVYGKTGTTSSNRDRWFCGFTKYYTAAVWVGYDQPEVISLYNYDNPAAVLFQKVLSQVHVGLPGVRIFSDAGMTFTTVCLDSGKRATEACMQDVRTVGIDLKRTDSAIVYREHVPAEACDKHVMVDFCVECGAVANEYCKLFAEKGECEVKQCSLVKLTQAEIDEIRNAKESGLEAIYYDDSYVYLITNDGKDGNFKGFDGTLNKNVDAPYIVATGHKKADWEEFNKKEESEKEEQEEGEENSGESTGETKKD